MVNIKVDFLNSSDIGEELKKIITNLENPKDYVLSLQLDYRDANSIFNLDQLDKINFTDDLLEIIYKNNTHVFFKIENILEYSIINKEDVIELEAI
ncbi:MAG: hypothetical protein IJ258_05565 [Methanobrevibacter sp.]|uniref:hypothetical protein n=1 Tax=Methanobrevibacter sp. TaxID=66852 RepID=UPI0025EE8892|nr:hypothetical protein [Methanobrevibacter sp.]MBQ8017559.1 hypothetical protein [Methanobrevibacter sp.]